jgi:hypothetical protein
VSETITDIAAERQQSSGQGEARKNGANPLKQLQAFGQSVWLDYLRRSLFTSGEFHRLIVEDGLRRATSNQSIFERRSPAAPITSMRCRRSRHAHRRRQEVGVGRHLKGLCAPRVEDRTAILIKSVKTDYIAIHKGSALKHVRSN